MDGKIKGHVYINFKAKNKDFNPFAMWPVINHP
jgi:hypothetical protein